MLRENSGGEARLPTIGLTGARGFVGHHLLNSFARRGYRTVAFTRDEQHGPAGFEARRYDLDAGLSVASLADIDVLIHGAFVRADKSNRDSTGQNIRGTSALYESATAAGVELVFLSTLSAGSGAHSEYGRHKYALENILAEKNVLVIRPGLVVGDGGLIKNLYLHLQHGIVPLIDGGNQSVQVVGTDDLAGAIECAIQLGLRGPHNVCTEESVTTSHIARTMADRFDLAPRYVSMPWHVAFLAATIAQGLGIALPLTTENLLGMRYTQNEMPSAALTRLGWKARTWGELLPQLSFGGRAE